MSAKEKVFSKKSDKLIGVPLLFSLSGFFAARSAKFPVNVKHIGLLRISCVADTLFIEPIIAALKAKYPDASITFFAGDENFNIARRIRGIDSLIRIYTADIKRSMKIVGDSGVYDLWFDFGIWTRFEAILSFSARARFKMGFRTAGEHRHYAYDRVADYMVNSHRSENYRYLISLAGVKVSGVPFLSAQRRSGEKLVIINMFADNENQRMRMWQIENWILIIKSLSGRGYRIAIIGEKKDIPAAEQLADAITGPDIDIDYLVGRLDTDELVAALLDAAILVSVDSGVLHIASALGVAAVGLYGPSTPEVSAPIGQNTYAVKSSLPCTGCADIDADNFCTVGSVRCMDMVKFVDVERVVLEVLTGGK